eukprot:gene28730-35653_t
MNQEAKTAKAKMSQQSVEVRMKNIFTSPNPDRGPKPERKRKKAKRTQSLPSLEIQHRALERFRAGTRDFEQSFEDDISIESHLKYVNDACSMRQQEIDNLVSSGASLNFEEHARRAISDGEASNFGLADPEEPKGRRKRNSRKSRASRTSRDAAGRRISRDVDDQLEKIEKAALVSSLAALWRKRAETSGSYFFDNGAMNSILEASTPKNQFADYKFPTPSPSSSETEYTETEEDETEEEEEEEETEEEEEEEDSASETEPAPPLPPPTPPPVPPEEENSADRFGHIDLSVFQKN